MNELFRIINGALRLDIDRVRNYTSFLADKLEKEGETGAAKRLRKLLEESDHQLRPAGATFARTVPVDEESRFPLIERVNLRALEEPPVVMSEDQRAIINEFLSVSRSHSQLEAEGLMTATTLLLYGPPGCGKSRLARFFATELGLELYVARLDGLISSFLGSTSKNIRSLFDFAAKVPCVLFLDEFDAIAKLRGDTQELGELKRVVNSFIQNLDSLGTQSIVLAATNHEELLDVAVWRRFSYRVELGFPSAEMREELWRQFLRPLAFTNRETLLLADLSSGFSGSDIQAVCQRLHRNRVTSQQEPVLHDAFQAMHNVAIGEGESRRFVASLKGQKPRVMAQALRERSSKLYSHAAVASLLGVSKATAHRWARLKGVSRSVE